MQTRVEIRVALASRDVTAAARVYALESRKHVGGVHSLPSLLCIASLTIFLSAASGIRSVRPLSKRTEGIAPDARSSYSRVRDMLNIAAASAGRTNIGSIFCMLTIS